MEGGIFMLEKLIEEGQKLEKSQYDLMGVPNECYEGVEFEEWSSKVALFFHEQSDSAVKSKILDMYSKLNKKNSANFVNTALGALKALKEMQ